MRLPIVASSLILFAAVSSVARADIVTSLVAAPTQVSGGYSYTYDVQLVGGMLDATSGGSNPTPLQFGTIYDFGPATFVSDTGILQSSFLFSYEDVNTPNAFLTMPPDNPNVANIRYTYDGTTRITDQNLGTFTVISPYNVAVNGGYYDGQSFKTTNNSMQGNVGQLSIPDGTTTVTPEPSTLLLLGTGLLGMAGAIRRRFV